MIGGERRIDCVFLVENQMIHPNKTRIDAILHYTRSS